MEITLDDVEAAIKVINEFIRRSREATITIKRLESVYRTNVRFPTSMNDFINMVFQAQRQQASEPEADQITEEDLNRIRSIKEKLKSMEKTEV